MTVKARVELRCRRDLEVSPEIHCETVLIVQGQAEKILHTQTLESEDVLGCVVAEIEDSLCELAGIQVGSVSVTGLDRWEWEQKQKTPSEP